MIERFPRGTYAIPSPHKVFHWRGEKGAEETMTVEIDSAYPPQYEGWECFFVSYFGFGIPQKFSYRRAT